MVANRASVTGDLSLQFLPVGRAPHSARADILGIARKMSSNDNFFTVSIM